MKILLDYKIEIVVKKGDKVQEQLSVFYREFTQAEKKEQEVQKKQFEKIFKKIQKIGRKDAALDKKAELYQLNGDIEKALKAIDDKEALAEEIDELQDELEAIGGEDQQAYAESIAKNRFDTLVSGKDLEKLVGYAETKGYISMMRSLDVAKVELEKKPDGE